MYVRPLKARVIDPRTGAPLPDGGAEVPETSYWHRRLRDGDVARGHQRKPTPKKTASASSSKTSEES